MLHVAARGTLFMTPVLKEGSFKMSYRLYAQHNYYGAIIPLLKLAVAPHAMHCPYYIKMHDCC